MARDEIGQGQEGGDLKKKKLAAKRRADLKIFGAESVPNGTRRNTVFKGFFIRGVPPPEGGGNQKEAEGKKGGAIAKVEEHNHGEDNLYEKQPRFGGGKRQVLGGGGKRRTERGPGDLFQRRSRLLPEVPKEGETLPCPHEKNTLRRVRNVHERDQERKTFLGEGGGLISSGVKSRP